MDQVRFSASGARVMVLSSGVQDGSGFGTATLSVLDTASGLLVYRRTRTADQAPNALRLELLRTPPTPATLRAAGLQPGQVSAARFNRVYPTFLPQWSDAVPAGQTQLTSVALWSPPVPIRLEVYALPSTCPYPDLLPAGTSPAGFRLSVRGQTVHRDLALPSGRRCAGGYTLERVDVQGDRALLTVRSYSPGFEGPDATPVFIAVTLK
ncbi:hypothetical protein CVO96_12970 [Deinococcus koreensis]|uniref:DUF2259 domain-containing protein n=1 Tax=Deinococcus koreensis TaxID=2054903 RepID=A0A2K3V2M8_9DEIO|nr:hypothetical protein CVO96_12970 [Deinococcus koreensis]